MEIEPTFIQDIRQLLRQAREQTYSVPDAEKRYALCSELTWKKIEREIGSTNMTTDKIRSQFRAFVSEDRFRGLVSATVNTIWTDYFAPWNYDLWNSFRAECPTAPTDVHEIRKLLLWCNVHEKPLVTDQLAKPIHDRHTLKQITHVRRSSEWYDAAAESFPYDHGGLDVVCLDCVTTHLEWLAEHPNWLTLTSGK